MLLKTLGLGTGLTVVAIGIGVAGDLFWGWDWPTSSAILLALVVMSIIALAAFDGDHPPTWGGGFWSAYTEMSGRETAGGGLSEMTKPHSGFHATSLIAAIVPFVVLIALLALALR